MKPHPVPHLSLRNLTAVALFVKHIDIPQRAPVRRVRLPLFLRSLHHTNDAIHGRATRERDAKAARNKAEEPCHNRYRRRTRHIINIILILTLASARVHSDHNRGDALRNRGRATSLADRPVRPKAHDGPLLSLSGHHSIIHTLYRTQPQTTPMRATSAHKRPANPFQSGRFLRGCGIPRRDLAAIHPGRQHLGAFKHSLPLRLPHNLPPNAHGRDANRYNLHPPRALRHITNATSHRNHAPAPHRLCNRPDRRVVQRTLHDLLQTRRREHACDPTRARGGGGVARVLPRLRWHGCATERDAGAQRGDAAGR